MSKPITVFGLTPGQRNRENCVWCNRQLGDDAVPAGIAVGYSGPHDLSVPVNACPDTDRCTAPRPEKVRA